MNQFIQPEFCTINYIDANINPTATITVTAGTAVGSLDYLWDYSTRSTVFSLDATDGTPFEIVIDLGSDQYVDTIKLLHMNFKGFIISIKTAAAATYTVIDTVTDYIVNSYWCHINNNPTGQNILPEEGNELLVALRDITVSTTLLTRYIKIRCTTTQTVNTEKFVSEIYIGARIIQNSTGSCQDYQDSFVDGNRASQVTSRGKTFVTRGYAAFGATFKYRGLTAAEFRMFRYIIKYGGNYTLFPTSTYWTSNISASFDYADIYLVTSMEDFENSPWGMGSTNDTISLTVKETVNVG
ncbi:MAG: hypothetical protein NTV01_01830 [Bacteroidia bacterium]|nr:hypothetical protein [Bacteroidia bacterium]